MVMAPYGILQSLLRERDLTATLSEVHRVLEPGGTFGIELVADLPSWKEYRKRSEPKGWRGRRGGAHVTLVETVRQDRARHLTIFNQEFTERRGGTTPRAPVRADVSHAVGARRWSAGWKSPGSRSPRCWATTEAGRGIPAPMCGSFWLARRVNT